MEKKSPSIWKQYGPMILMGSCCLAPALIGAAVSLAATTGLGLSAPLAVVALGGAGIYVWSRQWSRAGQTGQAGQSGMPCCPPPESSPSQPAKATEKSPEKFNEAVREKP